MHLVLASPVPDVVDIDTSRPQVTALHGKPMISRKEYPGAVVLDGKIYVFERRVSAVGEVFDPSTNQWDALPAPSQQCLGRSCPTAYGKKKKILLMDASGACAFDVSTNSWEYGVDFPSKVLHFMAGLYWVGERHVIQGDFLYMFDPFEFYAYDLQKKLLLQIHGLEQETRFMRSEDEDSSTFLIQLGEKNLCLVTAQGPAAGGLLVRCLKFHVVKKDGALHALLLGRDSYYIEQAFRLDGCVAMDRPGPGTSAVFCSF